jgi:hypothetical protein
MTKKDRSPEKPQASPNPRPRRRNKKQREPMAKAKKKESPVGTPINTPINTPERPPSVNSFSALQSDSDAEEEKSINTINADDSPVEVESNISQENEIATDVAATTLTPRYSNPSETPEVIKRSSNPTGPIAEIPPTDLERLKESVPLFASQLAQTVGQLFPEELHQTSQVTTPSASIPEGCQIKLKPPPVASLPPVLSPRMPDKYANSPYFNSRRKDPPPPMVEEDSKLPAVDKEIKQGPLKVQQATQVDSTVEQSSIPAGRAPYPENSIGNLSATLRSNPSADITMEEDRELANELFGSRTEMLKSPTTTSESMDVEPQKISSQLTNQNSDVIKQLNDSIERNKQSLMKLEDMLRTVKELQQASSDQQGINETRAPPNRAIQQASVDGANSTQVRDPFTQLATQKPSYPKLPDPSPRRAFFYRATWRIHIPNDMESPMKGLLDGLSEIWAVLKSVDDKIIIYPWKQSNHGRYKALSGPSKIPNTKEGINRYFPDAYFRPHPGPMYLNLYLGSSLSFEDLSKETQFFFGVKQNRTRVAFWLNELQFENIVEIGWLYRSTPGMSSKTIQQQLFAHTGIHTALRWKIISQPAVKGELEKEQKIRALHISVRRDDENLAKAKFTKLIFARH